MVLNGAAILAAAMGFRAIFTEGWDAAKPTYPDFTMEVESTGDAETYEFGDGLPQLREWVGERQVRNLKVWDYSLRNRDFELTVGVKANIFKDDKLGLLRPKFMSMGTAAKLHPDKLFGELLANSFTTGKGYDGVAFFSASHPLASGVQSNLQSGALSAITFNTAVQKLRQMKNWNGEPIDPFALGGELVLVVGPALESTARGILLAQQGSGGATNTDFGRAKLVVFNRITGNAWFLMVAKAGLKPFILQIREQPQVVARDQVDSECVFQRNEVEYGVQGRWEMGYGLYQLAVGSTGS